MLILKSNGSPTFLTITAAYLVVAHSERREVLRARDTMEGGEALALLPDVSRADDSHLAPNEESGGLDYRP